MLTRRSPLVAVCGGVFILLVGSGCEAPRLERGPLMLFPPPPAQPRIQFLTWASGAEQVGSLHTPLEAFVLGDEVIDRRRISKPYGLAARDGVVYVCDTKGLALVRMDFKNKYMEVMGIKGPGRLLKPINVAIDALDYKFVVDVARKDIVVFGPDNKYVTAFKVPEPCHPVDLAVYGSELFVLDNDATPQIVVFERQSGKVLRSFGSEGEEPGQFNRPSSIAIGPEGYIYVSDTMNWRFQKLTREGEVVWSRGGAGYRPGQFGRPRGLRVGPDGVIYIVDAASERIQMFNQDGEALMFFGGPGDIPGAMVLPSSLAIDEASVEYFKEYLHEDFNAKYLLFVANQYGRRMINVYAFGEFPEGYQLQESTIEILPDEGPDAGIGPVDTSTPPAHPNPNEEQPPDKEPD